VLADADLRRATTHKTIPSALLAPAAVYKLSLRGTAITSLPDSLRALTNLQSLDISGTAIDRLPEWIGDLANLQVLIASETRLTALPAAVGKLIHLHTVDVAFNGSLMVGVEHLMALPLLRRLDLDCNGPLLADLSELASLEQLLVYNIDDADHLEAVYALPRLKSLELAGGTLTRLPDGLSRLASLELLLLTSVPLRTIASDAFDLPRLKTFAMRGLYNLSLTADASPDPAAAVNWEQMFTGLAGVKALRSVDLSDNRIGAYHPTIGLLTQIKKLNTYDMVRQAGGGDPYPSTFANLTALTELTISDRDLAFETIQQLATTMPSVKVTAK
jgi:Leucine-rich repeat (LRR) protein